MRNFQVFLMILATYMVLACTATQPRAQEEQMPFPPEEAAKTTTQENKKPKSPATKEAKKSEANKTQSLLEEIEARYTKSSAVVSKIKKTLKLKLLDQERTQQGVLKIKKPGMFRLELEGTEKTTALTDGKTIWVVNYPSDPQFDNTIRIVRSKDPKKVQSQTLMAFILGQGGLLKQYVIKSQKEDGDLKTFELEAKNNSEEVNKITVVASISRKEIVALKYFDKLENLTSIEFSDNKFDQKLETKQFQFSAPKGAEITDI